MDEIAAGRFAFSYAYEAVNLIRLIQWDRADPDNIRALIADATEQAKRIFPDCVEGIDAAAGDYEKAIQRGLVLRAERLAGETSG